MSKIFLIIALVINVDLLAQLKPLSIGDKVPNIPLYGGKNFKLNQSNISEFKGKLVILDFWATWCGSCISALPKLDSLQIEFKDRLQIILVNTHESYEEVEQRLKRLKNNSINKALSRLSLVFDKTIFKEYFPNNALPHYVWIDKNGFVAYITDGYSTIKSNIDKFLNGEVLDVPYKNDFEQRNITGIPSLDNNLLPLYISGFYKYKPNIRKNIFLADTTNRLYRVSYVNKSLLDLVWQFYNDSIINIRNRTLIEIANPSMFIPKEDDAFREKWNRENLFTYEISIPLHAKNRLNEFARQDLDRFFLMKYNLTTKIEYREVECYILDIENEGLLTTTNGPRSQLISDTLISLKNSDIQVLSIGLLNILENKPESIRFVTDVKISRKVDVEISGNLRDFSILKEQLAKWGLRLDKKNRSIPFLVLREN